MQARCLTFGAAQSSFVLLPESLCSDCEQNSIDTENGDPECLQLTTPAECNQLPGKCIWLGLTGAACVTPKTAVQYSNFPFGCVLLTQQLQCELNPACAWRDDIAQFRCFLRG